MNPFKHTRRVPATVEQIFAAFQPERLARWWGPAGFTNTFKVCEFRTGGQWSFVMHAPDGAVYPNESIFAEVEEPTKVVIQHVAEPKFRLTIALEQLAEETAVHWTQEFESAEVARKMEHICVPANEQNLDRMTAEVLGA